MKHIFILNPYADLMKADDLRERLARIEGLDYFVFSTRYAGYEAELVRKVSHYFSGEKLRFYCCGGSGTMQNMLNGFDDLSQAEVAFYPCGLTNDFLKCFGEDQKRFYQLEDLIEGDVITVDYIESNGGVALNTFSTGLDAAFVRRLDTLRMISIFGQRIPYVLALLSVIFAPSTHEYEIYIDGEKKEGRYAEIIFGNGNTLGGLIQFSPTGNFRDGKGSFVLGPKPGKPLLPLVRKLTGKKFDGVEELADVGLCQSIRIARKDGGPVVMNLDGEIIEDVCQWEARIIHNGLHLVVPKGGVTYAK